jgi:membrane fusion protein
LNAPVKVDREHSRELTPPPAAALFRHEVLAERRTQWLGPVLLEPRVSHRLSMLVSVAAAAAILCILFLGTYTRKERISGWLMPEKGIVRVLPPQAGVVTGIKVKEGQAVAKGDPLLALSSDVESEALGATVKEVVRQLVSRRDNLVLQKDTEERLSRQQSSELELRLLALNSENALLAGEVELQRRRMKLSGESLSRANRLLQRGIITKAGRSAVESENLDQSAKQQALERTLSQLRREISAAQSLLRELPDQLNIKSAAITREIAGLEQQIAEAEARRESVIIAPQDGTVTGIQTELGGSAVTGVPLMSIVPKDAVLQAQLFSPSRAMGFIKKQQAVLMRYQPFPYQNFGFYKGNVANVSLTAISPSELPQQLAGLSALYAAPNEPFYRITVDLARQDVTAYGQSVALQPGMRVEADVLVERHRLIEWILYPLFARTSAWTG